MTDPKKYEVNRKKVEAFENELLDCGLQVKICLLIAISKEKYRQLKEESFWGYLQYSYFKLIVIDVFKFLDGGKYIRNVLSPILANDQIKQLLKYSNLSRRIRNLESIVSHLKIYRNKRFAHIDDFDFKQVSCDFESLLVALANLDQSISYIIYYLLNPHWIEKEEWNRIQTDQDFTKESLINSSFGSYFQKDPSLKSCNKILDLLNAQK